MDAGNVSGKASIRPKKIPPPVPKKKPKVTVKETSDAYPGSPRSSLHDPELHVPKDELLKCEDLTRLPLLYDDTVLACILERYSKSLFYTWAGPTLVALNPCRDVDYLYCSTQIKHHLDEIQSGIDRRDPHVYSVAGLAHHRLTHHLGSVNQAVLVSGESGAGKTESARYMLGYLTHVEAKYPLVPRSPLKGVWKDKDVRDIQERILASNPILEAFGNAATLRNHNSSRFGKLIRLQYGGRQLRGAEIDSYLLEKTRVTCQPKNERNFHIFYQLLAVVQNKELEGILLDKTDKYAIAPGEITSADMANFERTLLAFKHLDFNLDHQRQIFKVIAALLHLGNLTFMEENHSHQSTWIIDRNSKDCMKSLHASCDLLGLEEEELTNAITIRTICVGSARKANVFHKPCEREAQCLERRDALMQLLYQSLFNHIITFINQQVSAEKRLWSHFLGILDVYGFETFQQNSLEQLCINYANERLQQEFMRRYLATEHEVLKEEGLLGVDFVYTDNSACVMALDSSVSVFTLLNEECQLKRAVKEEETCDRVCKALEDTNVVYAPSSPGHTPGFVIRHYAGPVKYDAKGLLHKNIDEVPHEVTALLAASKDEFVGNLMTNTKDLNTDSGRRTTKKITTLAKFKSSLDTLMKTLSMCDLHYVRCVKPNALSLKAIPDSNYVMHQLKACGVIETVCISQAGYPVRISYEDFISRYGQPTDDVAMSVKKIAVTSLSSADGSLDETKCRFGHTRVFLCESALHTLENVREQKRNNAATCLQKNWRRYVCRQQYRNIRRAVMCLQNQFKMWSAMKKLGNIKKSCLFIQKNIRRLVASKKYCRTVRAIVIVQKYVRGWIARKNYRTHVMQLSQLQQYSSRHSLISMNSIGYYSLTSSTSIYSLNPSIHDASPVGAPYSEMGVAMALSANNEMLRSFLSAEHNQSLLETEESGIETDTESINGENIQSEKRKTRKLRRRDRVRRLLDSRGNSSLTRTGSDESLDDIPNNHTSSSSGITSLGCTIDGTFKDRHDIQDKERDILSKSPYMSPSKILKKSDDEVQYKRKSIDVMPSSASKIRIATMHNLEEWPGVLKGYTPPENLQMFLPKQSLSLFFKDGVLSYRRMPVVGIKFHTRQTCLPFSHHLPHHERSQGLLDILR